MDEYFFWTNDLIREDLQKKALPFSVLMGQLQGDMNISSVFRNGNAFGVSEVFYYGKKQYDRRGCVGIQNYTKITHLKSLEDVKKLKEKYTFVALEQSPKAIELSTFKWPTKPFLIVVGEEGPGIMPDLLELCEQIVYIKQIGSVRSINVSSASAICMHDHMIKYFKNQNLSWFGKLKNKIFNV